MGFSFLLAAAVQPKRMKRRSGGRRRREMRESKTWVAREIPLDLVIEILARLPAKSVMRFKCISRFWSSLFCSRYFCDRFVMLPSPPQPRLYMSLLDRYHYSKCLLLSSAPTPTPTTCPSSLEFDQDLTIRKMGGYYIRLLRGFICFTVHKKARIYNPSTRQLVILPAIESDIIAEDDSYDILYFIGHDPVDDQYKLLCTIMVVSNDMQKMRSEQWVFVVEAGGSWKRVVKDFHPHLPNELELNMDGVLYYLAWTDLHTCLLVSFNIRSEEFNMMQVPRKAGDLLPRPKKRMTQINYGGKVAVFDLTYLKESGTVDLWVVEDWKKKEWSRKTFVLQPSQMHLVTDMISESIVPKGTTLNAQVILVPQKLSYPYYFLCYDLRINDLKKVEIKGIPDHWFSKPTKYFELDFMNPSESIRYLKT